VGRLSRWVSDREILRQAIIIIISIIRQRWWWWTGGRSPEPLEGMAGGGRTISDNDNLCIYMHICLWSHNTLQIRITLATDDVRTSIILPINRYPSSSILTRNHCPISEHVLPEQSPLVISYYITTTLRYIILCPFKIRLVSTTHVANNK